MKPIETKNWDEFRVGDWFETIKNGKQVPTGASVPILQLKENGSTPRVTVSGINNGILGYYDYIGNNAANYRVFQNFVSVSFLGTVFYQPREASLDMKVHCLKPLNIELNEYTGKFLVSAIRASLRLVKYDDQISSSVLPNMLVKLPSKDNAPDWKYMEDYMRGMEDRVRSTIVALDKVKDAPIKIDHTNWVEFSMKDLGFKNFHGQRLTKKDRIEGNIPFITAGKENQGVTGEIGNDRPTYHNPITVDMFGNVFYHRGDFAGDDNIYFYVNDDINELCKQFIVVSAQRKIRSSFEYKDQFRQDNADTLSVKLPAKGDEPDWHYMEMYMRGVEAIAKEKISLLTEKKQEPLQQTSLVNYGTVNIYEK